MHQKISILQLDIVGGKMNTNQKEYFKEYYRKKHAEAIEKLLRRLTTHELKTCGISC